MNKSGTLIENAAKRMDPNPTAAQAQATATKLLRDLEDARTHPQKLTLDARKRLLIRLGKVLKRAKYRARFLGSLASVGLQIGSAVAMFVSVVSAVPGVGEKWNPKQALILFLASQVMQLASETINISIEPAESKRYLFTNDWYEQTFGNRRKPKNWKRK